MSEIDQYNHTHVGYFCNLPLYRIYEDTGPKASDEFVAAAGDLILGGGSGEHPAMVITNHDFLVNFWLGSYSNLGDDQDDDMTPADCFKFYGWRVENYVAFFEASKHTMTPYDQDAHGSLESWMTLSFGELLLFSEEKFRNKYPVVMETHIPIFNNVLCPPSRFPAVLGKMVEDGRVVWGVRESV